MGFRRIIAAPLAALLGVSPVNAEVVRALQTPRTVQAPPSPNAEAVSAALNWVLRGFSDPAKERAFHLAVQLEEIDAVDPYLERWSASLALLLRERGYQENGAYATLLMAIQNDVLHHYPDGYRLVTMMENTRQEHIGIDMKTHPVTPRTILESMALYTVYKGLRDPPQTGEKFSVNDLAEIDRAIAAYNAAPGIPYPLDRDSLFVIALAPFFFDDRLFDEMYRLLGELPGGMAVAFALFISGPHREASSADNPENFYAYEGFLRRSFQEIRHEAPGSERRRAYIIGLVRFLGFMAPYIVGWKPGHDVRRLSDRTEAQRQATADDIARVLGGIERAIASCIDDILGWIDEVIRHFPDRRAGDLTPQSMRYHDPFLLGLSFSFFSHIEALFPRPMVITPARFFLSLDAAAADDMLRLLAKLVMGLSTSHDVTYEALLGSENYPAKALTRLRHALEEIRRRNPVNLAERSA